MINYIHKFTEINYIFLSTLVNTYIMEKEWMKTPKTVI